MKNFYLFILFLFLFLFLLEIIKINNSKVNLNLQGALNNLKIDTNSNIKKENVIIPRNISVKDFTKEFEEKKYYDFQYVSLLLENECFEFGFLFNNNNNYLYSSATFSNFFDKLDNYFPLLKTTKRNSFYKNQLLSIINDCKNIIITEEVNKKLYKIVNMYCGQILLEIYIIMYLKYLNTNYKILFNLNFENEFFSDLVIITNNYIFIYSPIDIEKVNFLNTLIKSKFEKLKIIYLDLPYNIQISSVRGLNWSNKLSNNTYLFDLINKSNVDNSYSVDEIENFLLSNSKSKDLIPLTEFDIF